METDDITDFVNRMAINRTRRIQERGLWLVAAILTAIPAVMDFSENWFVDSEIVTVRSYYILLAVLILLFPYLYSLIFGLLPLENLRRTFDRQHLQRTTGEKPEISPGSEWLPESEFDPDLSSQDGEHLLAKYASASARVASSINARAGVYLLIGVLVAFSGLGFFYLITTTRPPDEALELGDRVLHLAPQFGILFFIEFIAFFFLRQYRSAMDEFRYFEAIQRRREELLVLIRLFSEADQQVDLLDLLKQGVFYSTAGKLSAGESTEILETRKLQKDEIELFQSIIEAIGKSKK